MLRLNILTFQELPQYLPLHRGTMSAALGIDWGLIEDWSWREAAEQCFDHDAILPQSGRRHFSVMIRSVSKCPRAKMEAGNETPATISLSPKRRSISQSRPDAVRRRIGIEEQVAAQAHLLSAKRDKTALASQQRRRLGHGGWEPNESCHKYRKWGRWGGTRHQAAGVDRALIGKYSK
jgi:hypothetical protein